MSANLLMRLSEDKAAELISQIKAYNKIIRDAENIADEAYAKAKKAYYSALEINYFHIALQTGLDFLQTKREGGFEEADVKAAIRHMHSERGHGTVGVTKDITEQAAKEIRAMAVEARAAQKDEALRAIFKSKVGVIAREIQADKDHFESRLTPEDNVNNMNGKGLVDGGTDEAPQERTAAEGYVQSREILVNIMTATERLLSDEKLDLSPITVSAAMEDARQEIAKRNGKLQGLSVSYETAVHDHAASIVQHVAKEAKAEAKLAM